MATWLNFNMQDANSPLMEQLIMFHDHTMMMIIIITLVVSYMMFSLMTKKLINLFLLEGQLIELIWTILPVFILIFIAIPSLKILYLMEEINKPLMTIKAIGHQWYWSYEYSDYNKIDFDSYMSSDNINSFRLLDTDNHLVLPFNTNIRVLLTSFDVIHSWTVPSLGLKLDCTPGRINQGMILINRPGLYFGQCSEICGSNHSFMPIVLESINLKEFLSWLLNY
uniref:cytochrome c oxidase subunit II n=1 Tax=Anaka burmensis TaxID=2026963 RepID=UPI002551EC63|nr:cytochrome c oxidase subunit II [Anaka burmensis]UNZ99512.1 cytochrome c oxidase subunit 2 [Anaka burmensis]